MTGFADELGARFKTWSQTLPPRILALGVGKMELSSAEMGKSTERSESQMGNSALNILSLIFLLVTVG